MKTLDHEWYIVMKAYKLAVFEILRNFFVLSYIACCAIPTLESTDSMMITEFSDHCTVEYIYSEEFAMQCKAATFLNAPSQLQQLSVTTGRPILWYTPHESNIMACKLTVILIRPHEAVLAS